MPIYKEFAKLLHTNQKRKIIAKPRKTIFLFYFNLEKMEKISLFLLEAFHGGYTNYSLDLGKNWNLKGSVSESFWELNVLFFISIQCFCAEPLFPDVRTEILDKIRINHFSRRPHLKRIRTKQSHKTINNSENKMNYKLNDIKLNLIYVREKNFATFVYGWFFIICFNWYDLRVTYENIYSCFEDFW